MIGFRRKKHVPPAVRRRLLTTSCRQDYPVIGPWPLNQGNGFFVSYDKEGDPELVVTSRLKCGFPDQTVQVSQGNNWANARPIKYTDSLALLQVYVPMRFRSRENATPMTLSIANKPPDPAECHKALMVGYDRRIIQLGSLGTYRWPGRLQRQKVKVQPYSNSVTVPCEYRERLCGSPVFLNREVIGVLAHWDYRSQEMFVAPWEELHELLAYTFVQDWRDLEYAPKPFTLPQMAMVPNWRRPSRPRALTHESE